MKFYTAEDGLAIMDHMISGKTVEEATALVDPTPIDIPVSEEVEEFCAQSYDPSVCPECGKHVADPSSYQGLCSQECYWNVFEDIG